MNWNRGGYNVELTSVQPPETPQEQVSYYNTVSGSRVSESASSVSEVDSIASHDYTNLPPLKRPPCPPNPGQSDLYEDASTLSREQLRPRVEDYDDDDYVDTDPPDLNIFANRSEVTLQKPRAYEEATQTLTRTENQGANVEYEDIPDLRKDNLSGWQKPDRQRERVENSSSPVRQKKRRCDGPNWRRVMLLWMVLLLGIIVAAAVYISLLHTMINGLNARLELLNESNNSTMTNSTGSP